jgi:hypothetical protein
MWGGLVSIPTTTVDGIIAPIWDAQTPMVAAGHLYIFQMAEGGRRDGGRC